MSGDVEKIRDVVEPEDRPVMSAHSRYELGLNISTLRGADHDLELRVVGRPDTLRRIPWALGEEFEER